MESTKEERDEIDRKTLDRYHFLNDEWHSAEVIVMQIDQQHANNRKSSLKKLFSTDLGSTPNSAETALASLRNVLASIPEKFSMTTANFLERKDSITSNDVFYEVVLVDVAWLHHTDEVFCFLSRMVWYIQ